MIISFFPTFVPNRSLRESALSMYLHIFYYIFNLYQNDKEVVFALISGFCCYPFFL